MKKLIISAAILFSSLFASAQTKTVLSSMDFTYPSGQILHVISTNGQTVSQIIKNDTLILSKTHQNRNGVYPIFKTRNNAYYALITSKAGNVYKKYITEQFKNK